MLLRSLFVLTTLCALALAQGGEAEEAERVRRKQAAIDEGSDVKEAGKGDNPDDAAEKDRLLTPEQRLARNVRHGASNFCTFVATPKPAKLMPGQTGVLVVTAILKGQAVLPSPAPLEITSPATQGLATLGSATFRPAEPGRLHQGYLGRPVYDNWAIFEVPVTMSPEAQVGRKQPVVLDFKFDLYDGMSAQAVGRFLDRAATEIEVGQSADPSVSIGHRQAGTGPVVAVVPAGADGTDAARGSPAAPPSRTVEAAPVAAAGQAAPTPVAGPQDDSLLVDEGSPLPVPLLVGGGALVVALLLLLARRK